MRKVLKYLSIAWFLFALMLTASDVETKHGMMFFCINFLGSFLSLRCFAPEAFNK